jgi:hypothetical protein
MRSHGDKTGLSADILNTRRLNVLELTSRMPSTARVRLAVTGLLVLMLVQEGGASSAPVLGGGVPPGIFYTIHSLLFCVTYAQYKMTLHVFLLYHIWYQIVIIMHAQCLQSLCECVSHTYKNEERR